uniref:Uncharacterized protein n=1 Tax=Timema genevievae TaxID=629358 RepID=A0A7R9K3C4_TIMGE|nr:unnamed protein product [Timema genevievae]
MKQAARQPSPATRQTAAPSTNRIMGGLRTVEGTNPRPSCRRYSRNRIRIRVERKWGKTTLSTLDQGLNLGISTIYSLIYCESSALDHACTERMRSNLKVDWFSRAKDLGQSGQSRDELNFFNITPRADRTEIFVQRRQSRAVQTCVYNRLHRNTARSTAHVILASTFCDVGLPSERIPISRWTARLTEW